MSARSESSEVLSPLPQTLAGTDASTPVLLAYSGGADSSALLYWLAGESKRVGFSLTLCHLDHGIRGEEARRDRRFCEESAARYGLTLVVGVCDVPARAARTGESLEEAAREERYAFFARVMRERAIPLLVTAHHADDQLETMLFRLARGTQPHGLCGIAPVRPFGDGFAVRPLLCRTREEIEAYCARHGIDFVQDSTNGDVTYARNRIRRDVLPVLEELFPGASVRAAALTARLREDEEYLDALAQALIGGCVTGGRARLRPLADAPLPVRRRALHRWIKENCGSVYGVHEEAMLRLISDATPRMEVSLPDGWLCVREGETLRLFRERAEACPTVPLCTGVQRLTAGWSAETGRCDGAIKIHNSSTSPTIILKKKFDIITDGLYWRARRDGDVLYLRGMHRKLRRLQAEAGIPVHLRDSLPLLCDGEGVLWAPCIGARDGAEETDAARGGLWIRMLCDGEE